MQRSDAISTLICQECYNKLEEFHCFAQRVAEKQNILCNDYFRINQIEEADKKTNFSEFSSIPLSKLRIESLVIKEVRLNDTIGETFSTKPMNSVEENIKCNDQLEESLSDGIYF